MPPFTGGTHQTSGLGASLSGSHGFNRFVHIGVCAVKRMWYNHIGGVAHSLSARGGLRKGALPRHPATFTSAPIWSIVVDAQAVLRRKGELSGKLDWENANLREKNPRRRLKGRPALDKRQADVRRSAMGEFVAKHNLTCFKCNTVEAEWAKTGISKRGPWAICTECVTSG